MWQQEHRSVAVQGTCCLLCGMQQCFLVDGNRQACLVLTYWAFHMMLAPCCSSDLDAPTDESTLHSLSEPLYLPVNAPTASDMMHQGWEWSPEVLVWHAEVLTQLRLSSMSGPMRPWPSTSSKTWTPRATASNTQQRQGRARRRKTTYYQKRMSFGQTCGTSS